MSKIIYPTALLTILSLLLASSCVIQPMPPTPIPAPPTPPIPPTSPQPQPLPQDTTPPEIIITRSLRESTDGNEAIFEWVGNDDKTPASRLIFSCFLKGYDTNYSVFTQETSKIYKNIPVGSYAFYVKSQDEAGNSSLASTTVQITIAIAPPKERTAQPPIISSLLILPNSEVNRITVSSYGNILYALDSSNAKLYKSEHGGFGWTNISNSINGTGTWHTLAIAPDDHNIIAVATNSGAEINLSFDGGINFIGTQLAGRLGINEKVKCLAISPGYGNNAREIAVGTSTSTGNGKVWISIVSRFGGTWQDCSTGIQGWLRSTSGVDVFAIKYSPSFPADGTLLAITASGPSATTGDTFLYIGLRDLATSNIIWNSSSGYPVEICQQGQNTPGTPLTYADLALPADYSGGTISQRHVYACWTDNPPGVTTAGNTNVDVYRLDDTMCYRLQTHPDTICSLAHYGPFSRGKLLAGAMRVEMNQSAPEVQVYCTFNPMSVYPTWQRSKKPPAGKNNAQVAWSPDGKIAYCGTSTAGGAAHDQSAFSRSTDNGLTWNQIGLIDN